MNRLSTKQRAQIVAALVEGNSIRATSRMTGAAKGTVLKLLAALVQEDALGIVAFAGDLVIRHAYFVILYSAAKTQRRQES